MSGIAMVGGALLIFALIVGPIILVIKMLGMAAHVSGALVVAHVNGTLTQGSATQQRLHARALESQRAAARA